jgi:hypothetical protein
MVRNNQKTGFYTVVFFYFGAIWAPPNGPKKVTEDPQVGGTYNLMSELKYEPITKLVGPFY